jgi:V/A-type H+-transporting ATPase subunit I
VPSGTGSPTEIAAKLEQEISTLTKAAEDVSVKLKELQEKHANYILASDEYLSIEVEKAELPLRMGATDHAFVLESWVPSNDYDKITKAFSERFGDDVYIELLETKERKEEHHSRLNGTVEAGVLTAEAITVPMSEETPVKLTHRKVADKFSFYTKLINIPRYNEIDPTIALTLFFPIFFGLMIGDLGYGLIFTILGWLGLKKTKSKDWQGLSTILFYGGIASMFFGVFLFGDLFGIEFTHIHPNAHDSELSGVTYTWAGLLGIDIPLVLFNIPGIDFPVQLGYFSKLEDVKWLLYISLWIGLAHLMIGLILGLYNVSLRHGLKAAIFEKFSWILMLIGGGLLLPFMIDVLYWGSAFDVTNVMFMGGLSFFLVGLVLALIAEGGKAIIELPELLSNVMSYTRITAIGMSKSGMALAFNYISIGLIAPEGGVFLVMALLVFVVGHLMIFILGLISAGLQSIRLQYVELFTKFFEGGGLEFKPLKIERKHTMEE